ncbi:hypothetical protein QBC35DRAFT_145738 [Podospora australis]|uniref:DRBM domain-containing protein n=1 Tax=Podospora australis TaxID=1536484 RepID=A0AAN6WWD4_9PEZI|nr:hypothetical protein QBC35DRAFT_145738 [Podospora australis]
MAYKSSGSRSGHQQQPAPVGPWRQRLEDTCRQWQIQAPVFQIVSDRRGGRTAWSSRVTVYGETLDARFWYDGKNINNATEDAAEVALNWLNSGSVPSSPSVANRSPRFK